MRIYFTFTQRIVICQLILSQLRANWTNGKKKKQNKRLFGELSLNLSSKTTWHSILLAGPLEENHYRGSKTALPGKHLLVPAGPTTCMTVCPCWLTWRTHGCQDAQNRVEYVGPSIRLVCLSIHLLTHPARWVNGSSAMTDEGSSVGSSCMPVFIPCFLDGTPEWRW